MRKQPRRRSQIQPALPDTAAANALVRTLNEHRNAEWLKGPLNGTGNLGREPFLDLQAVGKSHRRVCRKGMGRDISARAAWPICAPFRLTS